MINKRPAKIGFVVCTSHAGYIDQTEKPFPVCGMAEYSARELEKNGVEVIRYKELIKGEIKGWQVKDYNEDAIIDNHEKALEAAQKFLKEDIDCLIMFFPSFCWSSIYLQAINIINKPVIIWAGDDIEGAQGIGMFAVKGALKALGNIDFKSIYGKPDRKDIIDSVLSYIKVSRAKNILKRSRYGNWGGIPMGMFAGVLDDVFWFRKFGVIAEYLESQTIEREAREVSDSEAQEVYKKLSKKVKSILPFEDEYIKKDLKFYIAHKNLIEKLNLDFDSVKNAFEVADNYCSPFVSDSLLLEEGYITGITIEPIGALSMYILRLLSNRPVANMDVEQVEIKNKIMRLGCLTVPLNVANEDGVGIVTGPGDLEGESGMVIPDLVLKEGKITFCKLIRISDELHMQIATGKVIKTEHIYREKIGLVNMPFGTVKLEGDIGKFVENIHSQYGQFVYDDIREELMDFCKLFNIKPISS